MSKETIFLCDVDGVICNFIQGLIDAHGWDIKHDDFTSWNHHHTLGVSDEEMWKPTYDGKFWLNLQPYPWANELLEILRSQGTVIFCTSPSLDDSCPSQKVAWLRNHGFMSRSKNDYQIGPMKELNAKSGAILIDDSDSNIKKYEDHQGRAITFPQPWNEARDVINDKLNYIGFALRVERLTR